MFLNRPHPIDSNDILNSEPLIFLLKMGSLLTLVFFFFFIK